MAFAFLFLLLSSCSPAQQPTATAFGSPTPRGGPTSTPAPARYGGTLTLANRGDPPAAWDPMVTTSIALHHVAGALFGPGNLVMRCRENTFLVCPYLAQSWAHNAAYTEWTFNVRTDAQWHDGAPFTAEDAAFWLNLAYFGAGAGGRVRPPAIYKGELGDIKAVEALPNNRLRVLFTTPSRAFDQALANPRMRIAHPRHLMQPRILAGEVGISPLDVGLVGLGPFRLARYEKGSLIRLARFKGYWERDATARPLPYLDAIDYVVMPDINAMDVAFRTGRLDGGARGEGHYLTLERKQAYERGMGDGVFFAEIQGGQFRIAFNVLKQGPWQDARVRRAIGMWIDKESAIPAVMGGLGYIVPPETPFSAPQFVNWPYFDRRPLAERRTEAKQLMADAGYADGFAMQYLCRNNAPERCEFLKAQLADLNVDLQILLVDEATWNRSRTTLEFDSQNGANFAPPIPEATEAVYGVYSQNRDAYAKHEDPRVTQFYAQLRATGNPATRVDLWRTLERYLFHEQAYVIPIAHSLQVVPFRTYVKGLPTPTEDGHANTDFATVWVDK